MNTPLPRPFKSESRIAFELEWYEHESIADARSEQVENMWRHDRRTSKKYGRAPEFDLPGLFAVKVP